MIIMNPGAGPVAESQNTRRGARRNLGAFCRDLAMPAPIVQIDGLGSRESGDRDDGRYSFTLKRGIATVDISIPGIDLARVRYMSSVDGNIFNFPRLYIDGNSWIWKIGLTIARDQLLDYDGAAQRGYDRSVADCAFVMANEPRCTTCGALKDEDDDTRAHVNPPCGYRRVRCLICTPEIRSSLMKWDGSHVILDPRNPYDHGTLHIVTTQLMPYEALGGDADPICTIGYWSNRQCRLAQKHAGACESRWKELSRVPVTFPYTGAP